MANEVLEDHMPFIIAYARVEAYRQLVSDRARFRQWQNQNQTQNISVNELVQMLNDAEGQRDWEYAALKTWQRPTIGRIG